MLAMTTLVVMIKKMVLSLLTTKRSKRCPHLLVATKKPIRSQLSKSRILSRTRRLKLKLRNRKVTKSSSSMKVVAQMKSGSSKKTMMLNNLNQLLTPLPRKRQLRL